MAQELSVNSDAALTRHAVKPAAHGAEPPHERARIDPYDRLAATSPQRSIYVQRWWLDAVAPDRYRIFKVQRGTSLLAAWPVVTQAEGSRVHVAMPSMTQKLGILFGPSEAKYAEHLSNEHELAEELIEQLPYDGHFYHQFHERFTNWLPFYWAGYQQTTRYTYLIHNLKDLKRVWDDMRSHGRRLINKAVRNGIRIGDDMDYEELLDLNDRVFERQGMETPVSRDLLRRMDEACLRHAGRKIFPAYDSQGRLHAAAYIVWHGGTAYYLMAGSDPALRASAALNLAVWEAIRFASTVADTYDCEGSMIRGVEYSFRNLGAVQTPYFAISKTAIEPPRRGPRGWVGRKVRGAIRRALSLVR